MPPLSVMFKTVSSHCNLDCGYCYFRESLEGTRPRRQIDRGMLEKFVPEYMSFVADTRGASFGWQGGEPTLAGLDFYRFLVRLQAKHARPGTVISNDLQTNGILINDEWAAFFKQYNFLLGVSLDGPEALHNAVRRDRGGRGSFSRVMAGIDALKRHDVELNILSVIGSHNVEDAGSLMRFFSSQGFSHIQFMPAMNFQAVDPSSPAGYLISQAQYGDFLVELFDAWIQDGLPKISIRTFDNVLQSYLGVENDLCIHSAKCNAGVVVEYNGDVYPCDFYIHPEYRLGNVLKQSLESIARGADLAAFVTQKQPLPKACEQCRWKLYCNGGCPRNRVQSKDTGITQDLFCLSYKQLFEHAHTRFLHLSKQVKRRKKYAEKIDMLQAGGKPLPGRNESCPCGSGKKHKKCCQNPSLNQSYLFGG